MKQDLSYKLGDDGRKLLNVPLREINTSKVYSTGTSRRSNHFGEYKIIGQLAKARWKNIAGKRYPYYCYYLIEFLTGAQYVVSDTSMHNGIIKDLYYPTIYTEGYIGRGIFNYKDYRKEYETWHDMLKRCYSEEYHRRRPTYKDCAVDKRWHNFQLFCNDIVFLENYIEWVNNVTPLAWALDKDIKVKDNKLYSKNTCIFTTGTENIIHSNLTGLTYIATRSSNGYQEEFTNQTAFAEKYNLIQANISACCAGIQAGHKGWLFEVKGEE